MRRIIIALASLCFAGCFASPDSSTEETVSSAEELVDDTTFSSASKVVEGIDYLPFAYKVDGCYARSLYMAMELAATGRESNAIFAFARQGTSLRVGDIEWGYHVAPLLFVGDDYKTARWMVLDPSIAKQPLEARQWIERMGFSEKTPASKLPVVSVVAGTAYGPQDPDANAVNAANGTIPISDVPNFESMPPFQVSDIQLACNTMRLYLREEGAANEARKAQKLVVRTLSLISNLRSRGKLQADAQFSAATCAAASVAPSVAAN